MPIDIEKCLERGITVLFNAAITTGAPPKR